MKKIGIFGSAFNPPTKGHESAFMQCIDKVDEIWLVPSYLHAFGKKPLSYDVRCEMLSLYLENLKSKKIKISKIEEDFFKLYKPEYVYTYDILKFLKKKHQDCEFIFICGEDNAAPEVWSKFKNNTKIDLEFGKIVCKEKLNIRSTAIRENIKNNTNESIDEYIFKNVKEYILKNNLYK